VGEVEGPVVRAPARAVRADDAVVDQRHGEIGIEAPQPAQLQLLLVVHAAGEEAPVPVALAVVQARARLPRVDELDRVELARLEVEEIETVVEREHRAAFLAQRERPDVALERPVLALAAPRIEPPDRGLADASAGPVNPVEPAFVDVPHRAFAEMVGALENAFDLHETGDRPPFRADVEETVVCPRFFTAGSAVPGAPRRDPAHGPGSLGRPRIAEVEVQIYRALQRVRGVVDGPVAPYREKAFALHIEFEVPGRCGPAGNRAARRAGHRHFREHAAGIARVGGGEALM